MHGYFSVFNYKFDRVTLVRGVRVLSLYICMDSLMKRLYKMLKECTQAFGFGALCLGPYM